MNRKPGRRKITIRDVLIYQVRKIIAANRFGLTRDDLAKELISLPIKELLSSPNDPICLVPGLTLDQLLNDYLFSTELLGGGLRIGGVKFLWIKPTYKFSFVLDETLERFLTREFVGRKNEVAVRDTIPDEHTRERVRWGIVGL